VVKTNKAIYRHKRTGDLFAIETDETDTDNESVDGAYKKLAKKSYLDSHQASLIDTENRSKNTANNDDNTSHKSFDMTMLGTEKALLSSGDIDFKHYTPELAQNSAQRIQ
jgi:hypothetical protein